MKYLTLLACMIFAGACGGGSETKTEVSSAVAESCKLTVQVSGRSDVHERLMKLKTNGSYIVCPFLPSASSTDVFVMFDNDGLCQATTLNELPVNGRAILNPEQVAAEGRACSAVFSSAKVQRATVNYTTYIWNHHDFLPRYDVGAARRAIDIPILETMQKSGLPIMYFASTVNIYCFEVMAPEGRSPLELLKTAGFQPPPGVKEMRIGTERCQSAVKRMYNSELPLVVQPETR